MNYVEIKGGLGNQLFQYAFYRYCEKVSGVNTLLQVDFYKYIKNIREGTDREFKLDKFDLDFITIEGKITCSQIIQEAEFKGITKGMDDVFFSGYWQDKVFFEYVKEELIENIRIKKEYISKDYLKSLKKIGSTNSVAVHVRRGDYLTGNNKNLFVYLGADYYKEAIERVRGRAGEGLTVYIFTDEPENAGEIMEILGDIPKRVMPMGQDYEDLMLMKSARHHIIANSSFSWWAAALAGAGEGIIVAPGHWYVDRPVPNLYMDDFVVI